jgi:hypothetical protein
MSRLIARERSPAKKIGHGPLARRAGTYALVTNVWQSVVDRECPLIIVASGPCVAYGLTAPEAVAHSCRCLRRLLGETLAGPRLVRSAQLTLPGANCRHRLGPSPVAQAAPAVPGRAGQACDGHGRCQCIRVRLHLVQ